MSKHDGASNQLIPLVTNDGIDAVMGRDLHTFLEVKTAYKDWFPRMVEYGFSEGQDFSSKLSETSSAGGRPRIDHIVSLDMAKEISMIQRTDKGKQARQYFIECERRAKEAPALTGPELMARALIEANATMKAIEADRDKIVAELEAAAPKIEYHDTFVAESDLIQFRTLANQLNIGEQALRRELQRHGWIYDIPCERWSNKKNRKVIEHRWRCKADKKRYFQLVPQHEAPRLNGEVRQTLKITPDGAVAITKALRKWGVLDWPTIEGIA